MANNLTTPDPTSAEAGTRDLAWKALSLLFSPTEVALAELGADADAAIDAATAKNAAEMAPVPADRQGRGSWDGAMDERLRRLAAKVLPTASAEAATAWRDAMVEALSDLPAMIALTAAKKAIHKPFRFVGEVEPAIREIAEAMIERRHVRAAALQRMRDAIKRAANPAPALPAPEITAAGIRAMKPEMRALGLRAGFITQAEVDAALGYDDSQAEAA
ncbi:hypothetical protein [Sphingomonas sp. DC2300-3]|uniref:hypothetical protein n=1 Tax=unclassified Sphingomonas TaxID=196159 RepID=UPI003CE877C5